MDNYQVAFNSVKEFPKQALLAWNLALSLDLPQELGFCKNIVFCGMGGSALPADVIRSVFDISVPFIINSNFSLPSFVDDKTLVILASYSGNTTEVLSCLDEAKNKGCKIIGLTKGGELNKRLEEAGLTVFKYTVENNPSGQPRMGICYGIFGLLGIMHVLGYVKRVGDDLSSIVTEEIDGMEKYIDKALMNAKVAANKIYGKLPVVFAAEHLIGSAHILSNQINETAKTFSVWHVLPEANHHLLEGLKYPELPIIGIFLESKHYGGDLKDRISLTEKVLVTAGKETVNYNLQSHSRFSEVLAYLQFSSLLTIEVAKLNDEDPMEINTVKYFKEQLSSKNRD